MEPFLVIPLLNKMTNAPSHFCESLVLEQIAFLVLEHLDEVLGLGIVIGIPRCLVPGCDGVLYGDLPSREALWDEYSTAAPARPRQCVERYNLQLIPKPLRVGSECKPDALMP